MALALIALTVTEVHAKTLVIDVSSTDSAKAIEIPVHKDQPVTFYFPHQVRDAYSNQRVGFEVRPVNQAVGIVSHGRATQGTVTIVTEKWHIGAELEVVDDARDAVVQVLFRDVDVSLAVGQDLFYQPVLEPRTVDTGGAGAMHLEVGTSRVVGGALYCQVAIRNTGPGPLRIDVNRLDAYLGTDRIDRARLHLVDPTVQYQGAVATAVIRPGEPKHGILWLPDVGEGALTPLTLALSDLGGTSESKVTVRTWNTVDPNAPVSQAEHQRLLLDFAGDAVAADMLPRELWTRDRESLNVHATFLAYGSQRGALAFTVTNTGDRPFQLERVAVRDKNGRDLTAAVQVVGRPHGQVAVAIEPDATLTVATLFDEAQRLRQSGIRLALIPAGGAMPVVLNMSSNEWQRKGFDVNKGRKSVVFSGGGGVLQLDRGDDGSAPVGAYGFGGQFLYGVSPNVSVDIGLSGLLSGETELAGLTRSERLYRLHGGVRFLFDDKGWIPFARAGAGVALVSEQEGDGSSYGVGVFGQLGAGVTRWFSETFILGAELVAEAPAGAGSVTVVANLHLGFSWGGYEF
ncbi:hypothetical protein [Haliangium sp.]|uniref:hypothetical protein n=1 Tax=Haliangium sp. TaxID=2663208 RepID=UPI003D0A8416